MLRTRDLVLVVVAVVFLVLIIGATHVWRGWVMPQSVAVADIFKGVTAPMVTDAEVPPVTDERTARLAQLRAQLQDFVPAPRPEVVSVSAVETTDQERAQETDVIRCSGFRQYINRYPRFFLSEQEGARVILSSAAHDELDIDAVVAVLPIRYGTMALQKNCLPTDVVGIALDGSLIRVNEYQAYGIFGPDTLLGYALDGHPVYGRFATATLDRCGGRMTSDGYRYHIAPERESVLQCFVSVPVTLP